MPDAQVSIARVILDDDALCDDGSPYVGVIARASLKIPYGADWITSSIDSPGLWGIEADASEDYLEEVFQEERATLLDMLESLKAFEVVT